MNALLRQSWTTALRSGQYIQAHGSLRIQTPTEIRHCAMGVLMNLVGSEWRWKQLAHRTVGPFGHETTYCSASLPPEILGEVGLSERQHSLIASLNDYGATFNQIADIIDRDIDQEPDLAESVTREVARIRDKALTTSVNVGFYEKLMGQGAKFVTYSGYSDKPMTWSIHA